MSDIEQQGRTDHLESVLQTFSVAHHTGILHVERGKGGVREGGDIVILHGQVVEATAGTRQGAEALEWLLTWGNCQYNYQAKFPNELAPAPSPPPNVSLPVTPLPAFPSPTTSPLPFSKELITQNYSSGNGFEKNLGTTSTNTDGYLPNRFSSRESEPHEPARYRTDIPVQPPLPVVRAPTRMQNGSEALALLERFRLSRLHRHVFLLLDGKRTAHDLVRLTGRPLDEIERLLVDLERTGLIQKGR